MHGTNLEVDGNGQRLAALGLGHVAAVLTRSVLLELLLRHEYDELALQAQLVVAQVMLMPEVVCTCTGALLTACKRLI